MAELLIKVGDSGGSADGDVIAIKPDGYHIPAATMDVWFDEGIEPVMLSTMDDLTARRYRRDVARIRWIRSHTLLQIADEFGLRGETVEIREGKAQLMRDGANAQVAGMTSNGEDTNWGFLDLKHHLAVRVDGITIADLQALLERGVTEDYKRAPTAKRRMTFDYRSQFTKTELAEIDNRDVRVEPERDVPLSKTLASVKPELAAMEP